VGFSRLPNQPRGGPDGGDGGKGGNVYFEASEKYHSFEHLHKDLFFKAEDGNPGGKNKRHGKNGKDLIIYVPLGTTIYKIDEKRPLADLLFDGQKIKVAKGGRGGGGNIHFATSTNQAPRKATPGKEGQTNNLNLTFSPKADIVVIGPPNSGKSSLIASITGGLPKIADYPFTTKSPRLWTYVHNFSRYTFMDTPPLIPEAAEDINVLFSVLDCTQIEKPDTIKPIIEELEEYFEKDPRRKIGIVLAKTDKIKTQPDISTPYPVFPVSIEKEEGIEELKEFLFGD